MGLFLYFEGRSLNSLSTFLKQSFRIPKRRFQNT
jgi:hypothetical protein